MSNFKYFAVFLVGFIVTCGLTYSSPASAAGNDVICQVAFTTAIKGETLRTAACVWESGAVLGLQCDQDVYVSATDRTTPNNQVPDAGVNDMIATFSANKDPVPLYLMNTQKHVTVLGVTASGTCKFSALKRRY